MSEPAATKDKTEQSAGFGGNALRAGAGELALQADLAAMSVQDALETRIQAAENAWLAARHGLESALSDAEKVLDALKAVVSDAANTARDVDDAVRRSLSQS